MAGYPAIAATSEAVLGLLHNASAGTEFSSVKFEHFTASDFKDGATDTVSLYLYRVSVGTSRRSLPPRVGKDGLRFRPSLPVDLSYLVTAWAKPLRQQRLLAWCMRVIADTPILPAPLLNSFGPDEDVFRPSETVELVLQPLSQADYADVWEVQKQNRQPSATYVARMIEIDSTVRLAEFPLVQTAQLEYAEAGSA
jgi:uncharacterized protein DUF4255